MANILTTLTNAFRPTTQPVTKATDNSFAMGFVPGNSTSLRDAVLGQPYDANYDLLYAIYRINTDVSGSIDRWIGVVTGNDWDVVPTDPDLVPDEKLQAEIDRIKVWLRNPNPERRIKFDRLIAETITHLGITGDAFWHVIRDSKGLPIEINAVHPSTMRVVCDEFGVVMGYIQRMNGKVVARFEPEQIIHFRLPNALNDIYGQSPLERAMEEITQDVKAMAANKSLMDNGFAPAAMLLMEGGDEQDAKRLNKMITQAHAGTSKWHKLMAIMGIKDIKPWGNTLKDMQFTELRELTTSKIATAYGVPKMYLNQKNSADYATSDVLERDLYNNKGRMLQSLLNELITEDLIQSFNQNLKFQFGVPQFGDADSMRKDALALYAANPKAIDINELREKFFALPQLAETELEDEEEEDGTDTTPEDNTADTETNAPEETDGEPASSKKTIKALTKAINPDDLDALANQREAELDDLADDLVPAVGQYFTRQEADYLDRLQEDLTTSRLNGYLAANAATEDTALHMLLFGLLVQSLNAGSTAAQLQIDISLGFDQVNPMVQDYLQNQALEHAKGINQTTRDTLKAQLQEGLKAGESVTQLSERVQKVFTDAKGYRSTLIARAETSQAYAYANEKSLEMAGAEYYMWLTAGEGDTRVCPICAPLNGYVIRAGAQFPGGLEPTYAHLLCRCQKLAATKEDYDQFNQR